MVITDLINNKQINEYDDNSDDYVVTKYKVGDTVFDADEMDGGNYFIPNILYYTDYDIALKLHKKLNLIDLLY